MSWVRHHREEWDGDLFAWSKKDPACKRAAWLDLVSMAAYDDMAVRGNLPARKRGECVASMRYLAKRWAWSVTKVHRFMESLLAANLLREISGTPLGTIYLVVEYDTYNGAQESMRNTSVTLAEQKKRSRREKASSTTKQSVYSVEFLAAWKVHNRGAKPAALKAYASAVPTKISHDELVSHLTRYVESETRPDFKGAHLSTWINGEMWEQQLNGRPDKRRQTTKRGGTTTRIVR